MRPTEGVGRMVARKCGRGPRAGWVPRESRGRVAAGGGVGQSGVGPDGVGEGGRRGLRIAVTHLSGEEGRRVRKWSS